MAEPVLIIRVEVSNSDPELEDPLRLAEELVNMQGTGAAVLDAEWEVE
jgi:hypothetical protein